MAAAFETTGADTSSLSLTLFVCAYEARVQFILTPCLHGDHDHMSIELKFYCFSFLSKKDFMVFSVSYNVFLMLVPFFVLLPFRWLMCKSAKLKANAGVFSD